MSPSKPLGIYVYAMDGTGHLNACVGLAQALFERGHRITFLLNAAFKGQFAKFGFEEILLFDRTPQTDKSDPSVKSVEESVNPVKQMAQMLLDSGVMNGLSSLEKLHAGEKGDSDFAEQQFHVSVQFNPQIEAAIRQGRPDVIIVDHFYVPPAVLTAGVPWVTLLSCNPLLALNNPNLPPASSGTIMCYWLGVTIQ